MTSRLMFRVLVALVAFALLARIPVGFDVGFKFDAALAVIWAFGLLSLVLLTGYVGQISLCQATFAGVGAYTAGMMVSSVHVDYLVAVIAGATSAIVRPNHSGSKKNLGRSGGLAPMPEVCDIKCRIVTT